MTLRIRLVTEADIPAVVELSLLAWEPVFESFQQILGPNIYPLIYPDWRQSQAADVAAICRPNSKMTVYVADVDGAVAGFIAYHTNDETKVGEVEYLAMHPAYHNQGIGTQLNQFALDQLKAAGMTLAVVGTGGDPSHAAARRSYEKAGYTALPIVRYYKGLDQHAASDESGSQP